MGNDFTGPFVKQGIFNVIDGNQNENEELTLLLPDGDEYRHENEKKLEKLNEMLSNNTYALKSTSNAALQNAIDFSRAYYNYGDMSNFDDDQNESNDDDEDDNRRRETSNCDMYLKRMNLRNNNIIKQ